MPAEPIKLVIGDEEVNVPLVVNFLTVERIAPYVDAIRAASRISPTTSESNSAVVAAAIGVISGAVIEKRPDLSVNNIKRALKVGDDDQRVPLVDAALKLLQESGLMAKPGTPSTGEDAPPTTAAS